MSWLVWGLFFTNCWKKIKLAVMVDQWVIKTTIDAYDLMAEEYVSPPFANNPDEMELGFFEEHVNDLGTKILDVGCAYGRDADYFRRRGFEVIGVDLSKNMLQIARSLVPGVSFYMMDMRDLKFSDNSFDGVWADTSFLHVPKSEAKSTLVGFRRVLKNKGILFVAIHGGKEQRGLVVENLGPDEDLVSTKEHGLDKPLFFSFYEIAEFQRLLKESGFDVIRFSSKRNPDEPMIYVNFLAEAQK